MTSRRLDIRNTKINQQCVAPYLSSILILRYREYRFVWRNARRNLLPSISYSYEYETKELSDNACLMILRNCSLQQRSQRSRMGQRQQGFICA